MGFSKATQMAVATIGTVLSLGFAALADVLRHHIPKVPDLG